MVGCASQGHRHKLKKPSHQAAHANAWLDIQVGPPMCPGSVPYRRHRRVLRLVPHNLMHDCPLHCASVYGLRVDVEGHEPNGTLRPVHTLLRRRNRRRNRRGVYHAIGCHQNITSNSRKCYRYGTEECLRLMASGEDYQAKRRIQGVFPWVEAQDHHDDAQHGHLLASQTLAPLLLPVSNSLRSAYEMAKAFFIRRSTDPSKSI